MNSQERDRWKSTVLDEIFLALVADANLRDCLVFKGARVLNALLGGGRQSLDLDSNLSRGFVAQLPVRSQQEVFLQQHIEAALHDFFDSQDIVNYGVERVVVQAHPPKAHPMGWDAFKVKLRIKDLSKPGLRGLPGLEIDVASPEELLPTSTAPLAIGGLLATAYTLERIAGEKLRAFLSSLPTYRHKLKNPGDAVRIKDLYDLARILRQHSNDDDAFWRRAGDEFRIACSSRYVDCLGLETFQEDWATTEQTYQKDPTIPEDIPFEEVCSALEVVVAFWERLEIIPVWNPLPS